MTSSQVSRIFDGDELRQSALEDELRARLGFELRSWIGRTFLLRPPPPGPSPRLLNLGCGGVLLDGFVNADFFRIRPGTAPPGFWGVDLRYRLPCEDAHFDGVFCEHAIEHLRPADARQMLSEVFRVLKPGAWLRITFPDLARYAAVYSGAAPNEKLARFVPPAVALRSVAQGWGHRSLWDEPLMVSALEELGFQEVRPVGFRRGSDPRLFGDAEARAWETAYVEGRRPPAS